MPDKFDDLDLARTEPFTTPPDSRGPKRGVLLAVVALVLVGVATWLFLGREPAEAPAPAQPPVAAVTEEEVPPLGPEARPIDLPPLADSDAFVRELVAKLSSHPTVAAALATDGVLRNFVVVTQNVASGSSPTRSLRRLAPSEKFAVTTAGGRTVVDPASYRRYNGVADAVASLDAQGTAQIYATLKPRIEEAYRELGIPDSTFDATLERAIVTLLRTPVPDGDVRVEPRAGIAWAFADPRLEGLTNAQKQLIRMGPRNQRLIQEKLRQIAAALGIPAERLPT